MDARIRFGELVRLIQLGEVSGEDVARCFEVDPSESKPFLPRFRINLAAVDVSGVEQTAERAGHWLALDAQEASQKRAKAAMARGAGPQGGLAAPSPFGAAAVGFRIIAEGDSWFSHPLNPTVIDVLQQGALPSATWRGPAIRSRR